jgi:hypothetical protein
VLACDNADSFTLWAALQREGCPTLVLNLQPGSYYWPSEVDAKRVLLVGPWDDEGGPLPVVRCSTLADVFTTTNPGEYFEARNVIFEVCLTPSFQLTALCIADVSPSSPLPLAASLCSRRGSVR